MVALRNPEKQGKVPGNQLFMGTIALLFIGTIALPFVNYCVSSRDPFYSDPTTPPLSQPRGLFGVAPVRFGYGLGFRFSVLAVPLVKVSFPKKRQPTENSFRPPSPRYVLPPPLFHFSF